MAGRGCGLYLPRDDVYAPVPRGEVGLIMAGIGKQLGVVDDAIFSAVVIMVIMTTIVTPPLLKVRIGMTERRKAKAGVPS